jgi:plasmid maintenance system killer protein
MPRFAHPHAEAAYHTGLAKGVPPHVAREARWRLQLLHSAYELGDVRAIGPIIRWANYPGRYGLRIHGKWYITFVWVPDAGATDIRLERR